MPPPAGSRRARRVEPNGESQAVMALIVENEELARRLARRYSHSADADDLRQVANIALLSAARRYEPSAGPFRRFAVVTIVGELKKHLRSAGWNAHVPRRVQEDALVVQACIDRLTSELARPPRLSELAAATGLTSDRVRNAMHANHARWPASAELLQHRAGADDPYDGLDRRLQVRDAVERLSPADRQLVAFVYEQGRTQREIGELLGISQSQVQRRLSRVLEGLRGVLGPADDHVTCEIAV